MKRINRFRINVKKAILLAKRFYKDELSLEEKDELISLLLDTLIDVRHFNRGELLQAEKTLLVNSKSFDSIEKMRKEGQQ